MTHGNDPSELVGQICPEIDKAWKTLRQKRMGADWPGGISNMPFLG